MARHDFFQVRYQAAVVVSSLTGYILDLTRPVLAVSRLKASFEAIGQSFMFRYCVSQSLDKLILCFTHLLPTAVKVDHSDLIEVGRFTLSIWFLTGGKYE